MSQKRPIYSIPQLEISYNEDSEVLYCMRKEVLLAIFIGLSLGLIITYGVYTARSSRRTPAVTPTPSLSANPSGSPFESSELVITNPQDESIQKEAELTVTGTTWANAFVVVVVNDTETVTTADENGDFSVKVKLKSGGNIITVAALNTDGKQIIQERTVTWANDETASEDDESASPSPTARPSTTPRATATPRPTTTPTP